MIFVHGKTCLQSVKVLSSSQAKPMKVLGFQVDPIVMPITVMMMMMMTVYVSLGASLKSGCYT